MDLFTSVLTLTDLGGESFNFSPSNIQLIKNETYSHISSEDLPKNINRTFMETEVMQNTEKAHSGGMEGNFNPGIRDKLRKEKFEHSKSNKDDFKKLYLVFYNTIQTIGFVYILAVIAVRFIKLGYNSVFDTYKHTGTAMRYLHYIQYLEVLHPIIGLTKGGALVPFAQLNGKLFVIIFMYECEPRMQSNPVVCFLYIIWSTIEAIRHAYYCTQLCNKDYYLLTFIRYTAWIPLYPLGIGAEIFSILNNAQNFAESQKFCVSMPNDWNFSFSFPMYLKIHSCLLGGPGLLFVLNHMFKLMKKRLNTEASKVK